MSGGAVVAMLAARQAARRRVVDAFVRAGATSPATAMPLDRLGELDGNALLACIDDGTVREGAPGTFYLYARARASSARRVRIVRVLVFWLIILLLPVVVLQILNR